MNLLIVNDEVIAIQGMVQAIHWQDIGIDEVKAAYDASMAKEIISAWPVDVILCDIEMPGESGIELLMWIQEKGYILESIILTCHADFEFARQAVRLGCRDYILTPATYETIAGKISEAVAAVNQRHKDEQRIHYGDLWVNEKMKNEEPDAARGPGEIVEDVKHYICEHLDDTQLSVNVLAQMNYLSPDYLNRIFKKYHGSSIRNFIIKERMSLAGVLLMEKGLSFTKVAELVGYANYTSFVVSFKNYYGLAPSEYISSRKSGGHSKTTQ